LDFYRQPGLSEQNLGQLKTQSKHNAPILGGAGRSAKSHDNYQRQQGQKT